MKKNSLIALVCTIALTATIFAGCGSTAKTVAPTGPVSLTVEIWSSSPAEIKLVDDQIAEFNLENKSKNITLKKEVATGDYNQVMQTKIASKTEPDLFYLDVSLAATYISKGVIAPLDQYLDKEDLKDFSPNLLAGFQKNGKTYGLPKDVNTLGIFYNKKMLADAGVTPPKTWAEFEDAAKKLTKGKVKALSMADDSARFAPFILQAGGKINEGDTPVFNSTEAIKGFDFYYSMFKKGYAATPKDLGDGWAGDSLAAQKVAMVVEGGWMIPYMKEKAPTLDYGIAELPTGDKQGNLLFTVSYSMSTNTKHPKEAAEAIKFLTGKASQQMVSDSGLAIPSRLSIANAFTDKFPERKALVDGTKYATVYAYGLNHAKINDELAKAGERLRLGKNPDGKTALDEALKALQ